MVKETVAAAVRFAEGNQARFVDELKSLLRIPSVSTAPEHRGDVRRAAEFCAAELTRIGRELADLYVRATAVHPEKESS